MSVPEIYTELDLSQNVIRDVMRETFAEKNRRLTRLDLSSNEITILHPQTFINFIGLKELDLHNNKLYNVEMVRLTPNYCYFSITWI